MMIETGNSRIGTYCEQRWVGQDEVESLSTSMIVALYQLHCWCHNGAQMRIIRGLVCE